MPILIQHFGATLDKLFQHLTSYSSKLAQFKFNSTTKFAQMLLKFSTLEGTLAVSSHAAEVTLVATSSLLPHCSLTLLCFDYHYGLWYQMGGAIKTRKLTHTLIL